MEPTPDPSNHPRLDPDNNPRQAPSPPESARQEIQNLKVQLQGLQTHNANLINRNGVLEARHIQDCVDYDSQLQTKDGQIQVLQETSRQQEMVITQLNHDNREQRREHRIVCDRLRNNGNTTVARYARRQVLEIQRLERRHAEEKDIQEARIRRGIAVNNGLDWDNNVPQETMWHDDLENEGNYLTEEIWKKSHLQGNMSYRVYHPELKLWKGPLDRTRRCPRAVLASGPPFNFVGLPPNVKARIYEYLLVKDDIIHCISRISSEPGHTPVERRNSSRFPHVFFWKSPPQPCAIHLAPQPANVLKIFLVCKEWLHAGATCFYSMNTFAFSSLGEMGRFLKGIGPARRERIQSMELMHIGSIMKKDGDNDARTRPLQLLPSMVRLSHFTLYLNEGWGYRRRPYEEAEVQKSLIDATILQENRRLRRSIRTIHGMDYYYSMRGIEEFEVYDTSKLGKRSAITDQSALVDLHNQVKTPKFRSEEYRSKLENLKPFLPPSGGWTPSHAVRTTCRHFFNPPPKVYREPLHPRPLGGLGSGNGSPRNDSPHDDGDDDSNNSYPRDNDSRGRREDSGYHSSAVQSHNRDDHQDYGHHHDSDNGSGYGSDDADDNDGRPGPRSALARQRSHSVFPDAENIDDQSIIQGNSIILDSEATHNRSRRQGSLHHERSATPIVISDDEDDDDRPRFRGTLRRDRPQNPMFLTDDEDDEDYEDYSDDDSFLNTQTDRFGMPRPVLSELQSSIEFEDDMREIKEEDFSDDGMLDNQVIEIDSRAPSPDLDDFVIKEEMSTVDNPFLIDADDEPVIKDESVDENNDFGRLRANPMDSDDSITFLLAREVSLDLNDFVIRVEAATIDDPILLDDDDDGPREVQRESSNIDDNSSTIKSEGSSSAMKICVDDDEAESEISIKSEFTSSLTDDMRAFLLHNIDLSAGDVPHHPVDLTFDSPPHDIESRVMESLETSSVVSVQPYDSASNVAMTIADSILYRASSAPIAIQSDSRQELIEAPQESSEAGHSTKRTALAHHDGERRASKRQRSEGGPEYSSDPE